LAFILSLALIAGLLLPNAGVVAGSSPTLDTYVGTTHWNVQITEDESGCGGSSTTSTRAIYIQHDGTTAVVGDWAHGDAQGTVSGNTISLPARTIQDGQGNSDLFAFNLVFTSDCTEFSGAYDWNYYDAYQACSGSTSLRGTRTDGAGCSSSGGSGGTEPGNGGSQPGTGSGSVQPGARLITGQQAAEQQAQIINSNRKDLKDLEALRKDAKDLQDRITGFTFAGGNPYNPDQLPKLRADLTAKQEQIDLLQSKVESGYDDILKNDPSNFWANWDMAELRKDEGKYLDYMTYVDTAVNNEKIFQSTKDTLELKVATDLGLAQIPTAAKSKTVQKVLDDKYGWQGGSIYGVNVPKSAADNQESWGVKIYRYFSNKAYDLVNTVVGGP
jgi:hypothetical protein